MTAPVNLVTNVVDPASLDTQEIRLTTNFVLLCAAGGTPFVCTPAHNGIQLRFSATDITGVNVDDLPSFPFIRDTQNLWGIPLKADLYVAAHTGVKEENTDETFITVTL